ncbi:helix-turn-helix domain-containing protein [Anaerosinus massiliensis]|uniref:helix-turn-helix domain-containing protein n=1 Tax=Massilibacillus massiliensis TaxID=1806837 RepID=UPI000DA5F66F|nr:helix-turn-helix transcriptional regulator [Massilibacillus massiliensis]
MNVIRRLRNMKGISQAELGTILNVQKAAISKYELGRAQPSPDVLKKLSEYFNVSIDYLLENETNINDSSSSPSKKRPKELIKLIEQEEYTLNGKIATQEDREKLAKIIEALYWDAKEKNKRK